MRTIPGTMMSDEPYTLTVEQIEALNSLPPGIYHVCSGCRKFQPASASITFVNGEMYCDECARGR